MRSSNSPRGLAALCLALASLAAVAAPWKYVEAVDKMTDAVSRSVMTTNEQGLSLGLSVNQSGAISLTLFLPQASGQLLSTRRTFVYRVDDKKAQHGVSFQKAMWEDRFVSLELWDGRMPSPDMDRALEIIDGKNLLVRFRLVSGALEDSQFSLTGLNDAASKIVDIDLLRKSVAEQSRRRKIVDGCMANVINVDYSVCMKNAGM